MMYFSPNCESHYRRIFEREQQRRKLARLKLFSVGATLTAVALTGAAVFFR